MPAEGLVCAMPAEQMLIARCAVMSVLSVCPLTAL